MANRYRSNTRPTPELADIPRRRLQANAARNAIISVHWIRKSGDASEWVSDA
ncbi:hypothetical protein X777_11952 [Ooceraea biroi]|uniref:Uncharacterized protein n=1 Tax=Ooceraea biroi TaxID=2015173 RepID=A0A026W341_OOCBI|nr:hypothetical protein X777_11952 [Ooceraea biroi]